jgi:hypothetical protein
MIHVRRAGGRNDCEVHENGGHGPGGRRSGTTDTGSDDVARVANLVRGGSQDGDGEALNRIERDAGLGSIQSERLGNEGSACVMTYGL